MESYGRYTTMTLATPKFIRRFLMHVLPKGLLRVLDWPTAPDQIPSSSDQRVDCGQKQDAGGTDDARKGLTTKGPLQKPDFPRIPSGHADFAGISRR